MSFELPIPPRSRAGSRLIGRVRKQLILAAINSHVSQKYIADKMQVNRSVINRLMRGTANLTLRTVGELAWALDLDVNVSFISRREQPSNRVNSTNISLTKELRVQTPVQQRSIQLQNISQIVTWPQVSMSSRSIPIASEVQGP